MQLHESAEMYLETIYTLLFNCGTVRSIDVAKHLGYSKPSVSRAIGLLKENGLVTMSKDGSLSLTEQGTLTARKIFERRTVISQSLIKLGVTDSTAMQDACKIEHIISDESIEAIKIFINKN